MLFKSLMSYAEFARFTLPLLIIIAFGMDLILGDPERLPHPVRAIGRLIALYEERVYPLCRSHGERFVSGLFLAVFLPAFMAFTSFVFFGLVYNLSPELSFVLRCILAWQLLAVKNLAQECLAVLEALRQLGLVAARKQVARIVGRDTDSLSAEKVLCAAIESLAENFTDAVFAPLFFLCIGDLPLMLLYKTVSTLDSMIAYRSERYLYFGRAAARFDDILNFIPARVAGLLVVVASLLCRLDAGSALRIFWRDRLKHASPNSAHTEAAMAGALGIQLGGTSSYKGVEVVKPSLGDAKHEPRFVDLEKAVHLFYVSAGLSLFLAVFIAYLKRRLLGY